MSKSSVDKLFISMLQPKDGLNYYQVKLLADKENRILCGAYTHWVGYTESTPRREIREGSLVRPEIMIDSWHKLSVPYWVVSTEDEMLTYLCSGGLALVEKNLGEQYFADLIAPAECAYDGPLGFKSIEKLPEQAFFRAPRPKLRMKILKRDQYRCRLCGRRPADYPDLELHVHHIRPWANGGLTEEQNLICLCHTCHKGLSPHEEHGLFSLIRTRSDYAKEIVDGMLRYHSLMKHLLEQEIANSKKLHIKKGLTSKRSNYC